MMDETELQKLAAMAVEAAVEPSGVTDSEHGGQILVSTSARIAFRKVFPDWKRVRNNWLNEAIAEAFKRGKPTDFFKPKGVGAWTGLTGEIRVFGGARFIAIVMSNDDVRLISVKGTPSGIGTPSGEALPRRNPVPGSKPGDVNFGNKPEAVDFGGSAQLAGALKGH